MKNREGGHGERKDKSYFSRKIAMLFDEAEANGQHDIAAILGILIGSIEANSTSELSKLCADFAEQELDRIAQILKKGPKN